TSVVLRGVRVALSSDVGCAFVSDCCRNREKIFSDQQIREKYEITSDAAWTEIINNKSLRLAIGTESEKRMLRGISAQEQAAKIFTEAPEVLGTILRDNKASAKHRIDASRELRATARVGDDRPGDTADRVVVTINLGNDERLVVDSGPLPPKRVKEDL